MGAASYLRFVPSPSATIPIDWTKDPEASKKYLLELGWGIDYSEMDRAESDSDSEGSHPHPIKRRPLLMTINDLMKVFHESNFFGHIEPELCMLLDISEFGLAKPSLTEIHLPVGPRFYMRYLAQIWSVLFVLGYRGGITGYSPEISDIEDSYEDVEIARDKALAEDYDVKLCEEVRRVVTAGVAAFKKVAGWEGSTLKSDMQLAQMSEAIMGLPTNHPAHVAMVQGYEILCSGHMVTCEDF